MKIAFDIDGILAETDGIIRDRLKAKFGLVDSDFALVRKYSGHGWLPETINQQAIDLMREWWDTDEDLYAQATPNQQWIEWAQKLAANNEFAGYITRRPERFASITGWWLNEHECPMSDVLLCVPRGRPKSDWFDSIGAVAILEDSGHEASEVAETGHDALLWRKCYNEEYAEAPNLAIVHTPEEASRVWGFHQYMRLSQEISGGAYGAA
jgi:hypothetical protein